VVNLMRVRGWSDVAANREYDRDAEFEDILELYYKHVYRLIYRMIRNEADAADLTQETFIRVYRALPRLRHDTASGAWVRRIATNVCVDFLRRKRRTPQHVSLDTEMMSGESSFEIRLPHNTSVDPSGLAERSETQRTVREAIDGLPNAYRTVILLHHILDMRVEEVAATLGVPVGTVKSRLSRARHALARRLAPLLAAD